MQAAGSHPPRLRSNIAANFAGSIWTALMSIVFVPLYIRFMGIEAYGLVGFFVTMQALLGLLDMGLSITLNRELARLSTLSEPQQVMRNLVRTLESLYWIVGALLGGAVMALAGHIAHHWVNAETLHPQTIQRAILLMGLVVALQWPSSLYSGGLQGLQRQVLLNAVNVGIVTARGVGALLVLWLISPTVQAFFLWQALISLFQTGALRAALWHNLPASAASPSFEPGLLRGIWRFAAGMSGAAVAAVGINQMDKIVLSKMLSLDQFGYYAFASALAYSLYRLVVPFSSALFPRFTQLSTPEHVDKLKSIYHGSCQLVTVIVVPVVVMIVAYSHDILLLWTRDAVTAEQSHRILSCLAAGTGISCLMVVPGILQGAHGWTRLTFYQNITGLLIMIPLLVVLTRQFGVLGAASVWLILNAGNFMIIPSFIHQRLLPDEKREWYIRDVLVPLLTATLPVALCRWLGHPPARAVTAAIWLGGVYALSLLACIAAAHQVRARVAGWLRAITAGTWALS